VLAESTTVKLLYKRRVPNKRQVSNKRRGSKACVQINTGAFIRRFTVLIFYLLNFFQENDGRTISISGTRTDQL